MAFSQAETELCCDCILCLHPSSLRLAFTKLCDYLNTTVWGILCRHFLQIKFLCDSDVEAICRASRLNYASPSQEMILRLERRKDMTIKILLRHVRCACEDRHFKCVSSFFIPLHTKECPVYSVTSQYFSPMLLQSYNTAPNSHNGVIAAAASFPNYELHQFGSGDHVPFHHQNSEVTFSTVAQPLHLASMNNLSDPFKPYLVITQQPNSESLPQGDVLVLKCMAESDASITYSWRKDGKILKEHNEKVLMILDVQYSDSGKYICIAKTDTLEVVSDIATVVIERNANATGAQPIEYFATEKFALLIANEQYKYNPVLSSASNDALAIASTLKELGFKTVALVNLTLEEMAHAVALFCKYLKNGAYCVTYLAGHGFENDGQCYIVPIDAPKNYTAEHCFPIKTMIEEVRSSHDLNLAVFLLDVCRKRLNRNDGSVRPNSLCTKSGNFVISYATMEHGMAFEVEGRDLGVYASSLLNHLKKDKRITRVIELVHSDIHKNGITRGVQRPEFNSNIFEDRKLTDPVHYATDEEEVKEYDSWHSIHIGQKPNVYLFECGTDVLLNKLCTFSNQFLLEASIVPNSCDMFTNISVCIALKGHKALRQKILIENVQRFNNSDITVEVQLRSANGELIDKFEDAIFIPFTRWWRHAR